MQIIFNFFKIIQKIFFINKDYPKKYLYVLLFFFTIFTSLTEVATLGSLLPLIDVILNVDEINRNIFTQKIIGFLNIQNYNIEIFLFVTFIILLITAFILKVLTIWMLAYLTNDISYFLSKKIFKNTLSQNYSYHINKNTSVFMGNIEKVDKARGASFALFQMFVSFIISIFIIIFIFSINFLTTAIFATFFILIYGVIFYLIKLRITKISITDSLLINNKFKFLAECNDNIKEIILKKLDLIFDKKFNKIMYDLRSNRILTQLFNFIPGQLVILIASLFLLFLIYYYFSNETLAANISFVGMLILASQRLIPQMQNIFFSITILKNQQYSLYDIVDVIELKSQINSDVSKIPLSNFKSFKIKNLNFKFDNSSEKVFDNASCEFQVGKMYCLKGNSGSGKTTLIDLLSGLLKSSDGNFLLDEIEFLPYQNEIWQKKISLVPQNNFLIDGSILENITYGSSLDDISHSKINEIVAISELDDFLKSQKDGLNTIIGERGVKISGGQRQRISIARALYSKNSILIFDEATNALDRNLENKIFQNLKKINFEKIIIYISHHIETDRFANEIFEINNKKINKGTNAR